ncbi:MAG: NAD-dependent deacylase [Sphingomonadales bacterium]|jgi:NAD-dependent deacetylase
MNIVILTGAGISAESGVPTFRAADGLWEGHRVEDVATPQAFRRNPALVQTFYDQRRAFLAQVQPNPAHHALARLEAAWTGDVLLVTQNVDDLHDRAGSQRLRHMHGELLSALCAGCGAARPWQGPLTGNPPCPACRQPRLRPDIVWFGEMPYHMEEIGDALSRCDLFVSIGTSGAVYPAAGFVAEARAAGARTLEINLEPSAGTPMFHEARHGPAGTLVPAWVAEMLGGR